MIHLLFPGVTEARLFPYLSLPMLKSFLEGRGVPTQQDDLNILLTHRMLQAGVLRDHLAAAHKNLTPHQRTLLTFGAETQTDLWRSVFEKKASKVPYDAAFRILNNVLAAALSGSLLVQTHRSLSEALHTSDQDPEESDTATHEYDILIDEYVLSTRAPILGLSVSFFSQIAPALRVARRVRQVDPGVTIVLGGQQMSLHGQKLATFTELFTFVDGIVIGQGEQILAQMATNMEKGLLPHEIPGVITSSGTVPGEPPTHHIKDNPAPEFTGLPFTRYLAPFPQAPVVTCVGCYWGRCTFCSYGNRGRGKNYQQLTVDGLAQVIEHVIKDTSAPFIAFVDENCNLRLLIKAVEKARAQGLRFTWSTRNRLEPILADLKFTHRMADAGCTLMSVGYETNSQRLLDAVDKGVDTSQYQQILDNLHESGITLRLSVMGGLPGETEEEAVASREFLTRNSDRIGIDAAQMMIAEPTSRLVSENLHSEAIDVQNDDAIVNNEGFSYLGGRHGHVIGYTGSDRVERVSWLNETIRSVHPQGNDEQHPRWRGASAQHRPVRQLILHPWVVHADSHLVDLRWEISYRIAEGHVDVRDDQDCVSLKALTQKGETLLNLLREADVGSI